MSKVKKKTSKEVFWVISTPKFIGQAVVCNQKVIKGAPQLEPWIGRNIQECLSYWRGKKAKIEGPFDE